MRNRTGEKGGAGEKLAEDFQWIVVVADPIDAGGFIRIASADPVRAELSFRKEFCSAGEFGTCRQKDCVVGGQRGPP